MLGRGLARISDADNVIRFPGIQYWLGEGSGIVSGHKLVIASISVRKKLSSTANSYRALLGPGILSTGVLDHCRPRNTRYERLVTNKIRSCALVFGSGILFSTVARWLIVAEVVRRVRARVRIC